MRFWMDSRFIDTINNNNSKKLMISGSAGCKERYFLLELISQFVFVIIFAHNEDILHVLVFRKERERRLNRPSRSLLRATLLWCWRLSRGRQSATCFGQSCCILLTPLLLNLFDQRTSTTTTKS